MSFAIAIARAKAERKSEMTFDGVGLSLDAMQHIAWTLKVFDEDKEVTIIREERHAKADDLLIRLMEDRGAKAIVEKSFIVFK